MNVVPPAIPGPARLTTASAGFTDIRVSVTSRTVGWMGGSFRLAGTAVTGWPADMRLVTGSVGFGIATMSLMNASVGFRRACVSLVTCVRSA